MQNAPKLITVELEKIKELAALASAVDDAQSVQANNNVYKKLSFDMHEAIAEMLGPRAHLVYGVEEMPRGCSAIAGIESLAATLP